MPFIFFYLNEKLQEAFKHGMVAALGLLYCSLPLVGVCWVLKADDCLSSLRNWPWLTEAALTGKLLLFLHQHLRPSTAKDGVIQGLQSPAPYVKGEQISVVGYEREPFPCGSGRGSISPDTTLSSLPCPLHSHPCKSFLRGPPSKPQAPHLPS